MVLHFKLETKERNLFPSLKAKITEQKDVLMRCKQIIVFLVAFL